MSGVYALIKGFPDTIRHSLDIDVPKLQIKPKRIIVAGMGANYNAALLIKELLREEISVEVCQRPFLRNKEDLIFLLTYSGNTREIIEIFHSLEHFKNVVVVTSGGELMKKAKKKRANIIEVPPHLHPRFTFSECFFPVLRCLQISKIIKKKINLKKIVEILEEREKDIESESKMLAFKLKDKIPAFYSTEFFWPVSYRFQSSLAEDVKMLCHANKITELFHNELEALPKKSFFPVLFIDDKEARLFKKQIDFFKKKIGSFFYFGYEGYTREERVFLAFYLAYFLGYYLSLIKKTNMGETPVSDKIKTL